MSLTTRVGLLTGATAITLSGVASASNDLSNDELLDRLAAAEERIAELETNDGSSWLTEQRTEEIRSLVHDVLADADTRASLLQADMTAGYDNGAVIGSSDGNWLLRTNLLMQERFIYNDADVAGGTSDDETWGFENTRSKFILTGHVVNPQWFYRLDVNVGGSSGRAGTLNAFVGHDFQNGWKLQLGTFKAPLLREELVEAQYQLAVERSLFSYINTAGYVDGIAGSYDAENWRLRASFSDGAGSGQTSWVTPDVDWALTGRAEFLVSGNWEQFEDFTSPPGSEQGVMIGVAGHWQEGESDTVFDDNEFWALTADASIEGNGWNIFGALVYSDMETATTDVDPWGFVLQGGFYVADDVEIYGRYEWSDFDVSGADDLSVLTAGVNKYFAAHNVKWSTDILYGFDAIPTSAPLTGTRADSAGDDGQWAIRTQLQFYF